MPEGDSVYVLAERLDRRLRGATVVREDWEADEAARRLMADPSRPLASALLDQDLVAGFGNLWVDELAFQVTARAGL